MAEPATAETNPLGRGVRNPAAKRPPEREDPRLLANKNYSSVRVEKTPPSSPQQKRRGRNTFSRRRRLVAAQNGAASKGVNRLSASPLQYLLEDAEDDWSPSQTFKKNSDTTQQRKKRAFIKTFRIVLFPLFGLWVGQVIFGLLYATSTALGQSIVGDAIRPVAEFAGVSDPSGSLAGLFFYLTLSLVFIQFLISLAFHYLVPPTTINSLGGHQSGIKVLLLTAAFAIMIVPMINIFPWLWLWLFYSAYHPD